MPGIASAFQSSVQGFAVSSGMELLGGAQRAVTYGANRLEPNSSLGFEAYVQAFLKGLLSKESFQSHMLDLGFRVPDINRHHYQMFALAESGMLQLNSGLWRLPHNIVSRTIALSKNLPSPDELLTMMNRKLLTKDCVESLLHFAFAGEDRLAKAYLTLADQIPGPSDLIAFAVRDCFSPDIVQTFQYNKELPTAILPWMEKQGLGGQLEMPMPVGSTNTEGPDARTKPQWFDMYWWAHWQLPSVQQGYEMLQRLYPDSMFGPSPYASDRTFFSKDNLELLQKANDYPPYWRERLQAIAFHPLGRIDIKRMYEVGILKEDATNHDVFHAYRQAGYNDIDAKRLADYVVLRARKNIINPTVQQIDKLVLAGGVDIPTARQMLRDLFYPLNEINTHISNLQLQLNLETITKISKLIRKNFLEGSLTRDEATIALRRIGITPQANSNYLALWDMEKAGTYRYVSANKAIKLYKEGLINEIMLRTRLTNLHYVDLDINLLVQEAKFEVSNLQAKQLATIAKRQASEVEKTVKQQQKIATNAIKREQADNAKTASERAKLTKQDLAAYSEKNIIAFFKGGFFDWVGVDRVLAAKGWTPATIIRWKDTYLLPLTQGKSNAPQTTPNG